MYVLLVGAGYFRARIKGLPPFDKIVGGLTWCVLNCAVDLDVDLLYQENSSIGKKIALTEKIVAVLPNMNCPYSIEPSNTRPGLHQHLSCSSVACEEST